MSAFGGIPSDPPPPTGDVICVCSLSLRGLQNENVSNPLSRHPAAARELLTAPQLAKPLQICAYPASKPKGFKTRTEDGRRRRRCLVFHNNRWRQTAAAARAPTQAEILGSRREEFSVLVVSSREGRIKCGFGSTRLTAALRTKTALLIVNQASALAGKGHFSTQPPKCYAHR